MDMQDSYYGKCLWLEIWRDLGEAERMITSPCSSETCEGKREEKKTGWERVKQQCHLKNIWLSWWGIFGVGSGTGICLLPRLMTSQIKQPFLFQPVLVSQVLSFKWWAAEPELGNMPQFKMIWRNIPAPELPVRSAGLCSKCIAIQRPFLPNPHSL